MNTMYPLPANRTPLNVFGSLVQLYGKRRQSRE